MSSLRQNRYLFLLLVVASFFMGVIAIDGCRTATKVNTDSQVKLRKAWIFDYDFEKALYKTNMMIYGKEISGLTLIKKNGKDYRVVFMSELGLKYFDMEFFVKNDSVKIHHVINLLDKKPVVGMIEHNYKLIFMMFPSKNKEQYYLDPTTESMIKEIKYKGNKSSYTYNRNFGQVTTIRNKNMGSNLVISLMGFDKLAPQRINFNQQNLNLHLEKIEP